MAREPKFKKEDLVVAVDGDSVNEGDVYVVVESQEQNGKMWYRVSDPLNTKRNRPKWDVLEEDLRPLKSLAQVQREWLDLYDEEQRVKAEHRALRAKYDYVHFGDEGEDAVPQDLHDVAMDALRRLMQMSKLEIELAVAIRRSIELEEVK